MVKSINTANMTNDELKMIQESLEESDSGKKRRFREGFDPDDMGFVGRKEGV